MSKPALKFDTDSLLNDAVVPQRVEIQATPVFTKTLELDARIVLERGGAGSGKSFAVGQILLSKFLQEKKKKILILRKSLPYLRVSTYMMMKEIARSFGVEHRIEEEKVLLNWTYRDNLIHFSSLDNPEKIK